MKKSLSIVLSTVLSLSLICPMGANVHASEINDSENDTTITFTEKATKADKEFAEKRDKLIKKYGIDKAYEMLGSKKGDKNQSSTSPSLTSYGKITAITRIETNSTRAWMSIAKYYNEANGSIDFIYEITWDNLEGNTFNWSGEAYFDDTFATTFDGGSVYKVSTSNSSTLNGVTPVTYGNYGYITDHKMYARVIHTVKPRINGTSIYNVHGNLIFEFGDKSLPLPEGAGFSISAGYVSIDPGKISTFWKYHIEGSF